NSFAIISRTSIAFLTYGVIYHGGVYPVSYLSLEYVSHCNGIYVCRAFFFVLKHTVPINKETSQCYLSACFGKQRTVVTMASIIPLTPNQTAACTPSKKAFPASNSTCFCMGFSSISAICFAAPMESANVSTISFGG